MARKLAYFLVAVFSLSGALFISIPPVKAATVSYSFKTSSNYFSEPSVYTISFLAPKGLQIGYIGVSFSNPYVDFSSASLSVSGISGGTASVDYDRGISGNHDLQYKLSSVVTMAEDTWITLTVNGAKNPPGPNGSVGFDYISVYDTVNSAHDAYWTYNNENGTQLRMPTNHYLYLKEAQATQPVIEAPEPAPAVITPPPSAPVVPAPVIIQNTTYISITSVILAAFFYFDGSETTDLKKIDDPKHVDNFTLDTKFGWKMEYEEEIDFTDKKKLQAMENINKLVVFDYWFIWLRLEWWTYFDVPVVVTYKNDKLTSFAPGFKTSEAKNNKPLEVISQDEGELKLKISDAVKVQIIPRVEIDGGDSISSAQNFYTLRVRSSHKDLNYELKVNGKIVDLTMTNFSSSTGEFTVTVKDLVEGANFVQLLYKGEKDPEFVLADETTITVGGSAAIIKWLKEQWITVVSVLVTAALAVGATLVITKRKTV